MMHLAIVIWVVCGLLQLSSGQTACDTATSALFSNDECSGALGSLNSTLICSGTCRTLLDAVASSCGEMGIGGNVTIILQTVCSGCITALSALTTDSVCEQSESNVSVLCSTRCQALFNAVIDTCPAQDIAMIRSGFDAACGACGTAAQALQANAACIAALNFTSATSFTTICSGTCNVLLNNFVSSCRSQEGFNVTDTEQTLNFLCGGVNVSPACRAATNAVFSNSICTTATNNNDSATLCSRCRGIYESLVTACPSNPLGITQADINQQCGTDGTSGTGTIKGVGLTSLLLITTAIVCWVY